MKYILGIDAGGSKIALGLVDSKYKVSKVRIQPTSQSTFLEQLTGLIQSYQGFNSIALAAPGPVAANGSVAKLPNIKRFKSLNLKTYLTRQFQVPVTVINDAKAFALAEATLGTGKKAKTVLGVILGTGIGSGLVINRKLVVPHGLVGGELGHGLKMPNGETIEQYMQKQGSAAIKFEPILKIILTAAQKVNPDIIVVGGGRTKHPGMELLFKRLSPKLRISKLKNAGIIGAALALKK